MLRHSTFYVFFPTFELCKLYILNKITNLEMMSNWEVFMEYFVNPFFLFFILFYTTWFCNSHYSIWATISMVNETQKFCNTFILSSLIIDLKFLILISIFFKKPSMIKCLLRVLSNWRMDFTNRNMSQSQILKYSLSHSWWLHLLTLWSYLYGLWNPEIQCRIHKVSPIIPILSRIN